jgi:hypothetical protein
MAVGAFREVRARGLRAPEDVSVTGFDNVTLAQFSVPTLTTVHIPRDQIGRVICDCLMRSDAPSEQEFVVEVDGVHNAYVPGQIQRAPPYLGKSRAPFKVSWQSETRLRFAIKDPQPGELQHLCAQASLRVTGVRRLRIGRIALAKLPLGEWRALGSSEKF